jgi:hypothetical protein
MPFFGSVQKLGWTCSEELKVVLMLLPMSLAVMPNCRARARSMSTRKSGA